MQNNLVAIVPQGVIISDISVTGKVVDQANQPLIGASVKIKGVSQGGAATNVNGVFTINVPENAVLVITYLGYNTQEIPVNGRTTINITLKEDSKQLDEVVVIGYGTAAKKDLTGSISSIKATQLENENPQSVSDILRGNIPGLNVGFNTSAKGGGDLLVRGKTTLSGGTDPVIVLDGVIYYGQLADINPNDIESVDVLKDASSLAVYGAKAATGVIAITTKKGKSAIPTITFNTNFGLATLTRDQKPYNAEEFLAWRADVMRSGAATPPYLYNHPNNLPEGVTETQWRNGQTGDLTDLWLNRLGFTGNEKTNYLAGKTENWYDDVFQRGLRQDHTLSLSGKKEEVTYYMSLGYQKNQNTIQGGEFSSFRTRINLEGKAAKFVTVGVNFQYGDRNEGAIEADWGQVIGLSPYGDKYNADGTLRRIPTDDSGNAIRNPYLNSTYNSRMDRQNTIFGSLYTKVALPFGITYQLNFSPNFDFRRRFDHLSSLNPEVITPGGSATRVTETRYNWQVDNLLKWNQTFARVHNFDVTLLANAEKLQSWSTTAANQGFQPSDVLGYHNLSSGLIPSVNSTDVVYTGDALMGRLNYTLLQRYNLSLSARRDGYSGYGAERKRAFFPSAAVAWTFTEEPFFKNISWFNYGKVRLSYGLNGNRNNDPYLALFQLETSKYQLVTPSGTVIQVNTLANAPRMGNDNLQWEQTSSLNAALDFSLFNNILGGTVEVYNKKTTDLLVTQTLPDFLGYLNVFSNLAQVSNKGFELSLNSKNIQKEKFKWNSNLIFSLNRNKIDALATPENDTGNGWFIGKDINTIWDYKILGVWQEDEVAEANKFNKAIKPGDFKLLDVDGNYVYDEKDRQFLGYTTPRFTWALRNDFNLLKNLDFSFQLLSNWGQKRRFDQAKNNPGAAGYSRSNSYKVPYWTAENPINDFARLNSGLSGTNFGVYRNNSFIRLNTVALAYTIPANLVSKAKLRSAKVYFNINNAAVYAPTWDFWDPQNDGPTPRYSTLGLNVSL
ncbi:MAG: SusC/RagA family TonB-linked outer membrane protein [Pyrinomonadaceae bacterium]|nr:SusC/RagA family TonB-linked outer membrane protein [Sphingobacteriaceae bacterium]